MNNKTKRAAWVEINLSDIVFNYESLKILAGGSEVIACIKADAYGHGAAKTGWELVKAGVDMLGVATLSEAIELRSAGITKPIVLLGATPRMNMIDILDFDIIPVITTAKDAAVLSETIQNYPAKKDTYEIFAALETGMGRLGFTDDSLSIDDILFISNFPGIHIKGLFSHLSTADEEDRSYTEMQINKFNDFGRKLVSAGLDVTYKTLANSAGTINYPESHFDAVRPGLALYGLYPGPGSDRDIVDLRPAMSVKANIVYIKKMPPGSGISYGKKFVTARESVIGTLPLGYADGLPRILSGKGRVIVNGEYAPIIGNICMDQCMIDLTDIKNVNEYDEVTIMGKDGDKEISAEEIAEKTGTISYEVVCRFGQRLPKIYK